MFKKLLILGILSNSYAEPRINYVDFASWLCQYKDKCDYFLSAIKKSTVSKSEIQSSINKFLLSATRSHYFDNIPKEYINKDILSKRFEQISLDTSVLKIYTKNYFMTIYDSVDIAKYESHNLNKNIFYSSYVCTNWYRDSLDFLIKNNPLKALNFYLGSYHNMSTSCLKYNAYFLKFILNDTINFSRLSQSLLLRYLELEKGKRINKFFNKWSEICNSKNKIFYKNNNSDSKEKLKSGYYINMISQCDSYRGDFK